MVFLILPLTSDVSISMLFEKSLLLFVLFRFSKCNIMLSLCIYYAERAVAGYVMLISFVFLLMLILPGKNIFSGVKKK